MNSKRFQCCCYSALLSLFLLFYLDKYLQLLTYLGQSVIRDSEHQNRNYKLTFHASFYLALHWPPVQTPGGGQFANDEKMEF